VQDSMYYDGKRPEVLAMRDRFWRILLDTGVLAAFFGHEHNYSRTLIDRSVNPAWERPIWQIITGGGGAPFYGQQSGLPWSHQVRAFAAAHHQVFVEVRGRQVFLRTVSLEGETLDEAELTAARDG
jgi:3',5'-cyclic-AMP phosphodiesterase